MRGIFNVSYRKSATPDGFQAARFGNATGGVQTNSEENAVAVALQTFIEQQFDFLLRKDFGLSVSLYFHAGVYTDPTPESLPQILHYCIRRGYFLMRRVSGVKGLVRAIAPGV
jgi:hypothetical protein